MDTVSKYDIAEVVSHIGSQTLLPSPNRVGGVEFGGLLAKALGSEEAAKAASQVDESGEDLPISVLDLKLGNVVTRQQADEDQLTQSRENNPSVLQHLEHFMQAQTGNGTTLAGMPDSREEAGTADGLGVFPSESERGPQSLSSERLDPGPLIRVATLREKRQVILGPENSALATTFAQGSRWHLSKDIENASEISLGVTTSSFAREEKESALAINSRSSAAQGIKSVTQRIVTESAVETESNPKITSALENNPRVASETTNNPKAIKQETKSVAQRIVAESAVEKEKNPEVTSETASNLKSIKQEIKSEVQRNVTESAVATENNPKIKNTLENNPKITNTLNTLENNPKVIDKAAAELLRSDAVNSQMQVNEAPRSVQRAAAWTFDSEIKTSPSHAGSSKKLQQAALRIEVGSESTSLNNSIIKEEGGAAALFSREQQTQIQGKLASEKTKIQIKPSVIDITADNTGASQNSAKTEIERFDAHINAVEGKGFDLASVGLSAANSFEKPQPTARFELASRPVLVSNFAADMKETIVGQLAKITDGVTKFTVALYPENFGKVNIEISYSEIGGLRISMAGDNLESVRVLEQNLPALRESLQNDKLSELAVNLNSNQDSQGSSSKNGKSNNNTEGGDPSSELDTADLTDQQAATRERQLGSSSEDGLDTYV